MGGAAGKMALSLGKNHIFPRENGKLPRRWRNALPSALPRNRAATLAKRRESGFECYEMAEFCSHFIHT
jgi:hypothetical protein